jgi:glycogen debranching enzyme
LSPAAPPPITLLAPKARKPNVIKHGSLYLVVDEDGQVSPNNNQGCGLYDQDTRLLSALQWAVEDSGGPNTLTLLNATLDGATGIFIYGVSPCATSSSTPDKTLIVEREVVIDGRFLFDGWTVTNYHNEPLSQRVVVRLGADFVHNFQYRGAFAHDKRGQLMVPRFTGDELYFGCLALDDQLEETRVVFTGVVPTQVTPDGASFDLTLGPGENATIELRVEGRLSPARRQGRFYLPGRTGGERIRPITRQVAGEAVHRDRSMWIGNTATVTTGNTIINEALQQGARDVHFLLTPGPSGELGIVAGTPIFVRHFGRDGAIAAGQVLWAMLDAALGTARVLAEHQGRKHDDFTGEQPGRIAHEPVTGALARCNLIPHKYGSIDATPLFIRLVGECFAWTGDTDFLEALWPHVELALGHLAHVEEGGFLAFKAQNELTLANQSWMDSRDSMRFADGSFATPPLAVCEVQAYLFQAWRAAAAMAKVLGKTGLVTRLERAADSLKRRFNTAFWMDEQQYLALALQEDGRQVDAIGSNAGHCLGIQFLDPDKEARIASALLSPELFSGYGVRTKATNTRCYNPLGYHLGSVWAWDTAACMLGLCRMGQFHHAHKILFGTVQALRYMPDRRLPELFAGFALEDGGVTGPVGYPGACWPQAWSSGAIFQMVAGCLGLRPDAHNNKLFVRPFMPHWLSPVVIKGLRVGNATVDLTFTGNADTTAVNAGAEAAIHVDRCSSTRLEVIRE